eukprot:2735629-Amphidinium_carterae.2
MNPAATMRCHETFEHGDACAAASKFKGLTSNYTRVVEQLNQLAVNGWIDAMTRAVWCAHISGSL